MKIEFIRGDALRNVQGRLLGRYGGLPGLRDENLLESALARPRNLHAYEDKTRIPRLAAAVGWTILRNRPLGDGNRRAAFAAVCMFLHRNGYELTCTEVTEKAMVLRALASELSEAEWTAWLHTATAPSPARPILGSP